jgi:hypothetical protein
MRPKAVRLCRAGLRGLLLAWMASIGLLACGKDADPPVEPAQPPARSSSNDAAEVPVETMQPVEPVDLAAACRPWLDGGPAAGLEAMYATLLAVKRPEAVARYEKAVQARRLAMRESAERDLFARLELLVASEELWDESLVRTLASLSERGFDLYMPETLAAAEREASLPPGSIANALGLPKGFDPAAVRYGMLEYSARTVAASLANLSFPPPLIAALLREDVERVAALAREMVADALKADLERRGIGVPASFRAALLADDGKGAAIAALDEAARATLGVTDLPPEVALDRWIVAAMGLPVTELSDEEAAKAADSFRQGAFFWLAYTEAMTWSLPLPTADIEALRSDDGWGAIPRANMHAAMFAFLGLSGGRGAEWLGTEDPAGLALLCRRPLWDAESGSPPSFAEEVSPEPALEDERRTIVSEIDSFGVNGNAKGGNNP